MRVAVIGSGAIGTVLAGAAADSGHDVTVCARTPIDSLVLECGEGEGGAGARVLAVTIATDPRGEGLPSADVVWVTTKLTDIAGAGPWLERLCGPSTVVAAAQNGLDHEAHLAPFAPAGRVVPALAYVAAERIRPGRVRHLAGDRIVVPADVQETLAATVSGGGLVVRGVTDMRTALWQKLLGNLVANPITALTMRRIGVMREPGIADLARGLLAEAIKVGRAEGAQLGDHDVDAVLAGTSRYGESTGSSMLYDRLAGRPLEHQYLTGEVVRRANAHGIAVPLNSAVLALLEAVDRGREDLPAPA
ncbi:MAG: 2-dehydropantoate 2-reductase [Acidimicrobiales bacterium]